MIATPSAMNLPGMGSASTPPVSLGEGDDLHPKLIRWAVPGAVIGLVLWLLASPPGLPLHDFLHQRGPTQVVCLVMGGMLAVFIFSKWQLLQQQSRKTKQFDLALTPLIRSGDLDAITNQSQQSRSLVGKRIMRLLNVWTETGSAFQLERSADNDADLFELALQQSYSLPKVLLWAIPLLGFIGTVLGMSAAVGSFDEVLGNADNVEGLKNGLTQVTSGLGTAFDTTYLALLISVIMAFPLNSVERREERLLNQIDGFIREAVMALSPLGEGEIGAMEPSGFSGGGAKATQPAGESALESLTGLSSEELAIMISDAFEKHLPDPSVLVEPAQAYAELLTEATVEKLSPLTNLVRDSVEGIAEARLSLQDQADVIRSSMDSMAGDLSQTMKDLDPVLTRLERASGRTFIEVEQMDQLQALVELRQAIEQLNGQLQQIERPRRRRWFW
tara:strand:+ start:410 stop:1747 length:1338 start_codon:yes stop_codon:yes gene_type:complete